MVNVRCCYVCERRCSKDRNIILHAFPKNPNAAVYKNWISALDLYEGDYVKNLRICSRHFVDSDYQSSAGKRLKPCAVPSVKVPNPFMKTVYERSSEKNDASESNGSPHYESRSSEGNVLNGRENILKVLLHNADSAIQIEETIFETAGTKLRPAKGFADLNYKVVDGAQLGIFGLLGDDGEYGRLPVEETEFSLTPETNLKEEELEEEDQEPLELTRSPDSVYREEEDEPRGLSSYPFTVPRYFLDRMMSRLRRTRLEMRTVKDSLHVQTIKTESLQKTNEMLLEKITDLRRKVHQLEFHQTLRACKEVESNVNIRGSPFNLKKAEKDFVALRNIQMMPRYWSFVSISAGLLFLLHNNIGPSVWPVEKCVLLRPDMTLSICLRDRPVRDLVPGQMKCMLDVLAALKTVESARPCIGIGGICFGEGILTNRFRVKCDDCSAEKKLLINEKKKKRQRHALLSGAKRKKKRRTEMTCLRQKLRRLQAKLNKKKETEKLEQEDALSTQ